MRTPDASRVDRSRRPTTPVLVLAWLLATVVAGGIAWGAVSVIGGARGAQGGDVLSQAQVAAELAEQRAAASVDAGGDPVAPETAAPGPTASPTGTAPAPPATESPAPPVTTPSEPPPGSGPGVEPPAPAGPAEVARTWDVAGGQVGAVCTGAAIGLLYATPLDGWTIEVHDSGPERLEVRFSRSGDGSRVRAQCVGGTPAIDAQSDEAGDGGGDGGGDGEGGTGRNRGSDRDSDDESDDD